MRFMDYITHSPVYSPLSASGIYYIIVTFQGARRNFLMFFWEILEKSNFGGIGYLLSVINSAILPEKNH